MIQTTRSEARAIRAHEKASGGGAGNKSFKRRRFFVKLLSSPGLVAQLFVVPIGTKPMMMIQPNQRHLILGNIIRKICTLFKTMSIDHSPPRTPQAPGRLLLLELSRRLQYRLSLGHFESSF